MKLLLDTHVFLWYITADPKLPPNTCRSSGRHTGLSAWPSMRERYLAGLEPLHRDPFDRLLVAQALQHGLTIATVDPDVTAYPVPLLPVA